MHKLYQDLDRPGWSERAYGGPSDLTKRLGAMSDAERKAWLDRMRKALMATERGASVIAGMDDKTLPGFIEQRAQRAQEEAGTWNSNMPAIEVPDKPGWLERTAGIALGAAKGARMGAEAGALNVEQTFTFGQIESINRARERVWTEYGLKGTWAETGSNIAAGVAREALISIAMAGAGKALSGIGKASGLTSKATALSGRARGTWQYGKLSGALGVTDEFGNVTIRSNLVGKQLMETVRHESVHRFLSVPKPGAIGNIRAALLRASQHSHLATFLEEGAAETFATHSVRQGLAYPFRQAGVSGRRLIAESAGYVGAVVGSAYGARRLGERWFGEDQP